jgi:bacterioferritin-associated ferredoxin
MQLHINLPGYEDLRLELDESGNIETCQLQCSPATVTLFNSLLTQYGRKISTWEVPISTIQRNGALDIVVSRDDRRASLLMQELVKRAQGLWRSPFAGEIVCTCRGVTSESIDQAIVAGAKSIEEISLWTTACTACTTCKFKIEDLLKNRTLETADSSDLANENKKSIS